MRPTSLWEMLADNFASGMTSLWPSTYLTGEVITWFRNWIGSNISLCIHTWSSVFPTSTSKWFPHLKFHFSVFRLLDQLPRANAVLLWCLFGVLNNIKQHSSYNEMTAFALSQHIAPSLLCLPNPCSTEAGMYLMKRVRRFLIFMSCGAESPPWVWNMC